MAYLKCKSCGGSYELQPGESPDDFESCQCGGELEFYDDQWRKKYYNPDYSGKRRRIHPLIQILVIIVGGLLISTYGLSWLFGLLLYGLLYLGQPGGTILFAIFFGGIIAAIVGLLWFGFKKR